VKRFYCRKCKSTLTKSNWSSAKRKGQDHICNPCTREVGREYSKAHREECRVRAQEYHWKHRTECLAKMKRYMIDPAHKEKNRVQTKAWQRKNHLHGFKGKLKEPKRDYPVDQKCELCHTVRNRLHYHHWDDAKPWKGVWCCIWCHGICEFIERRILDGVIEEYAKLKASLL